ncbi:MAG TPA: porin [Candidatus Tripitaka californicus]|uniref:porin n=1 Tax=Candidatus Tripitaka californicus TaxID=3367616 RepID=UPI00402A31C8|nr:hypothetical protein [Planctomycetota bacterium]
MKQLIGSSVLFVSLFSSPILAAQDTEILYLTEHLQALEKTVMSQKGEIESQRREIEALKARPEYVVSKEELRGVTEAQVKDYLGTDEFVHEAAKVYPSKANIEYKVGKGFTFETLDKKFLLEILGRLQTRYDFRDKEDARDTSSFRINRLRWRFRGHAFSPNLHYLTEFDLSSLSGGGQLKDAYVDYHFFPELHLRGGQWKVPYNRQNLASDYAKQFIDESITNDAFSLGRDIGLMVYGAPFDEHLEYYAGIFTGRGINATENTNNQNMLIARVGYRPFGRFNDYWESDAEYTKQFKAAFGTSFATNNGTQIFFNNSLQTFPKDAQFRQYGIDSIMKYRGFSLQGEFHLRSLDRRGFSQSTANGFFVQGGYFPIPKRLELAARYAQVDPNVNVSNDLQREFAFGTNWYFSKHHHKIQANISRFVTDRPTGDKEDTVLSIMHQLEW